MLRLPSFAYLAPKTLKDALAMKADAGPNGMFVAGGTDLYPNMKRRHQEPKVVITLMGIPEMRRAGGRTIGSFVTLTGLSASPPRPPSTTPVCPAPPPVSTPLLRHTWTVRR